MPTVNTVSGPVDTSELGFTLMHEHIIVQSPGVKENFPVFDRQAEIDKAAQKLKDVQARGVSTLVDLTPGGLARHSVRQRSGRAKRHAGHRRDRHLLGGPTLLPDAQQRPSVELHRRSVRAGHHGRHHGHRRQGRHHQVRHRRTRRHSGRRAHPARIRQGASCDGRPDLDAHPRCEQGRPQAAGRLRGRGRGPEPRRHRPQRRLRGHRLPHHDDASVAATSAWTALASTSSCRRRSVLPPSRSSASMGYAEQMVLSHDAVVLLRLGARRAPSRSSSRTGTSTTSRTLSIPDLKAPVSPTSRSGR